MQIDRPIAIAVTLFIIILLVFFLVVPEYNTFKNLQTDLGEKRAEFNAEYDYYAAISKTYLDLQGRQDDIKKIDNALPQESSLGKLVYSLQKTAGNNGLIIKDLFLSKSSVSNTGTGSQSDVNNIIFSMDLLGDYSSLNGFVASLEQSSRIFEVTNISFESSAGPPYSFNIQIKTYSY